MSPELRTFYQSAARYNEEQAANAVAQRQQFILQMGANYQALLRQTEEAATASFLAQITAIQETIRRQHQPRS